MGTKGRHAALSISLPKPLRRVVEERVRSGGFGNVSDYIRSLIRNDQAAAASAAKSPPLSPLPGLGAPPRKAERMVLREEPEPYLDLSTGNWRELREVLLHGDRILRGRRLCDSAAMLDTALTATAMRVRQDDPNATDDDVAAAMAAYLHQDEHWQDDRWFRTNPDRLRRILHG